MMLVSLDGLRCSLSMISYKFACSCKKPETYRRCQAILWTMKTSQLAEIIMSSQLVLLKDLQKSQYITFSYKEVSSSNDRLTVTRN